MCAATKLTVDVINRPCPPELVPFETTAQAPIDQIGDVVGQARAIEALRFGIGIQRDGYNMFVVGPSGVGKRTLLEQYLHDHAAKKTAATDWCYVHNFNDPDRPLALSLPASKGVQLQKDMTAVVGDLRVAMRSAFDSEEYRTKQRRILTQFKEQQQKALSDVQQRAKQRGVGVVETESGIMLVPLFNGEAIDMEQFQVLPKEDQEKMHGEIAQVTTELQELFTQMHERGRKHHEELKTLDREMATAATNRVLNEVRKRYEDLPDVLDYLSQVEHDVIENAPQFLDGTGEGPAALLKKALRKEQDGSSFWKYRINVVVDRSSQQGAPVIYEDNPTHNNVIGRIEHESQFGAVSTNFTLIRAGALHKARGGYLILDIVKVLQNAFTYDALKRTLRSKEIRIESIYHSLGLAPSGTLEAAPIPLGDTKIVLCGERQHYYLLASYDPDFLELFKVLIDFEDSMVRDESNQATYAKLIASLVNKEKLRPFDKKAVARVITHAARTAGDSEKLSLQMRIVTDLLREADYWAGESNREAATEQDVQKAIDAQTYRADRVKEHLHEGVQRGDLLLSTEGEAVGQINGLTVFHLGEHYFGHPVRITARVRMGHGEVIDIEREVAMGGPIHSKGVMILTGYLGAHYAPKTPMTLSATLVFEQSYSGVEGDSASMAELCALLSSIAKTPIKQSFAMTGSVNQYGQSQSIGGVNEKIEGYFDICQKRGLTGNQGVIIPKSNAKHLMLRSDVVDAVKEGKFHIYTIENVDDALELLTGLPAGVRNEEGKFPVGSINARVEAGLLDFARNARDFQSGKP